MESAADISETALSPFIMSQNYQHQSCQYRNTPARQSNAKGNLKTPRYCINQGMRQQKGTRPIQVKCQNLDIVIIHTELKSYVFNVLKYYNQVFLTCIRSINLYQNRLNTV